MATSSKRVLDCKHMLVKLIIANDYDSVRWILDEVLPTPLWSEQVEMTQHLNLHVNGAYFEYNASTGWYYTEEGA